MATVRAARLVDPGKPLAVETIELPDPAPGEVRVELAYGGVNPVDSYVAAGRVAADAPRPRTLGGEASGRAHDRDVFVGGHGLGTARDGVWAEAGNFPEAAVAPLPEGVDLRAAAAMGVAGVTAWNVVTEVAAVTAADRVLVLGASGGVGSIIVPLVHSLGATVWGQTGSEQKAAFVTEQGANRTLVCGARDLAEKAADLKPTVIFDPLGGDFVRQSIELLEPHGRHVTFGTSADAEVNLSMQSVYRKGIRILGYAGLQLSDEERGRGLAAAFAALRDGKLKVRIDDVLPLDHVEEAFERFGSRSVQGKLLLDLGGRG